MKNNQTEIWNKNNQIFQFFLNDRFFIILVIKFFFFQYCTTRFYFHEIDHERSKSISTNNNQTESFQKKISK